MGDCCDEAKMMEIFNAHADGDRLTKEKMKSLIRDKIGKDCPEQLLDVFFKRLDSDNSGDLNFEEFKRALKVLMEMKKNPGHCGPCR